MTKNPYELRFNVLELARNHLMEEYMGQLDLFRMKAERDIEYWQKSSGEPTYPSPDDVIKLAQQFKTFVDG